jgi:hypothetical protein
MKEVLLLFGKNETDKGIVENYQLMLDSGTYSADYHSYNERIPFYEDVSKSFAEKIIGENSHVSIGFVNGAKIDSDGNHEHIGELEKSLISLFVGMLCCKLKATNMGTARIVSDPSLN